MCLMNFKTIKTSMNKSPSRPKHIMTVDVEDYFMVEAFSDSVSPDTWSNWPSRVADNTKRILDLFDAYNVKGTFFFVGWVAEKFPELVRDVHARKHELACHSYWHRTIYSLTPDEFRDDTRAAIYPIHHDLYGVPGAHRFPYDVKCRSGLSLREYPPATIRLIGQNLPGAGGGYLRIFPLAYTNFVFRKFEREHGEPVVVYFHPWEIDPGQPRIRGKMKSRFRHYTNLAKMEGRLHHLLETRSFVPIREAAVEAGNTIQVTMDDSELKSILEW